MLEEDQLLQEDSPPADVEPEPIRNFKFYNLTNDLARETANKKNP